MKMVPQFTKPRDKYLWTFAVRLRDNPTWRAAAEQAIIHKNMGQYRGVSYRALKPLVGSEVLNSGESATIYAMAWDFDWGFPFPKDFTTVNDHCLRVITEIRRIYPALERRTPEHEAAKVLQDFRNTHPDIVEEWKHSHTADAAQYLLQPSALKRPLPIGVTMNNEDNTAGFTSNKLECNAPAFEKKKFIYGVELNRMGESDLLAAIKVTTDKIESLEMLQVNANSNHITKKIATLQRQLEKIVKVLDNLN